MVRRHEGTAPRVSFVKAGIVPGALPTLRHCRAALVACECDLAAATCLASAQTLSWRVSSPSSGLFWTVMRKRRVFTLLTHSALIRFARPATPTNAIPAMAVLHYANLLATISNCGTLGAEALARICTSPRSLRRNLQVVNEHPSVD